jgi:sec-independent protein translocase protein TatB
MAPGIGWTEIVFIVLVMLVVIKPERLPGAIRSFVKYYQGFRNYVSGVKESLGKELTEIQKEADLKELNPLKELKELKDLNDLNKLVDLKDLTDISSPKDQNNPQNPQNQVATSDSKKPVDPSDSSASNDASSATNPPQTQLIDNIASITEDSVDEMSKIYPELKENEESARESSGKEGFLNVQDSNKEAPK